MKNKPVILVVDDEPINAMLLADYIANPDYEIIKIGNGEETLKIVEKTKPDLILLDVMMPKIDGFEVTRKIRANKDNRLIPIVLVTALDSTDDKIKGIEAGCDDFISKPFDKNEVCARVKTILKLNFFRRQLDEKAKFETILHKLIDGIVVCSPDWQIVDINEAAKNYLIITPNQKLNLLDFLYQNFSLTIAKENIQNFSQLHQKFDIVRESTLNTKALYLEAHFDILKNPVQEVTSIVLMLRDVTESRSEELLKQNFLSLISHKLRTPLLVITETMVLFKEGIFGEMEETQKKVINDIYKKAFSLAGLVEKLIGFTTIMNKNLELNKENINLEEYLPKIIDYSIKQSGSDKNVDVKLDFALKLPDIHINKIDFDLIIGNIIENAIKFNDKILVTLKIAVTQKANNFLISISDNGIGIAPEEKEKIFEKFYQSEKYFTGNISGAGLGLAIVKRLVEAYGGKIILESTLGQSSTFNIHFPGYFFP